MTRLRRVIPRLGDAALEEPVVRFHIVPYPPELNAPINQGVSPTEVQRKDRANAAWWKQFDELMQGSSDSSTLDRAGHSIAHAEEPTGELQGTA